MSTISSPDEISLRWDQFFEGLHFRLDLLARYRQQTNRLLAQDFNVFAYIAPGENRLSDMLADLLDPAGAHGQGAIFLKRFLAMLEQQYVNQPGNILSQVAAAVQSGSPVAVSRELPTSGRYCEIAYGAELATWLEQCKHDCEAEKVRWFLRDFLEYVQQQCELMPEGGDSVDEQ